MKIRIGHLSTFYHTAILLMAKDGITSRLGIEVEWRLMGTGPAIVQAFERKELDLAYIGLPPAIIGISRGVPLLCVAGGHMEGTVMAGKGQWQASVGGPDLEAVLGQFRGRTIGVPGKGSIHDVILKDALEKHGLADSVEIRNFAWADLVLDALAGDEVAAAVGTPALAAAIKRYAKGKLLVPASAFWPDNPSYGLVASRDLLDRNPAALEGFLRLHEEATALIRQRPREAARLIAGVVGIVDEDLVLDALRLSPKYCTKLTAAYMASTMRFVPVLRKHGYITADVTSGQVFLTDLIDKVHPEKDHYGEGLASVE